MLFFFFPFAAVAEAIEEISAASVHLGISVVLSDCRGNSYVNDQSDGNGEKIVLYITNLLGLEDVNV